MSPNTDRSATEHATEYGRERRTLQWQPKITQQLEYQAALPRVRDHLHPRLRHQRDSQGGSTEETEPKSHVQHTKRTQGRAVRGCGGGDDFPSRRARRSHVVRLETRRLRCSCQCATVKHSVQVCTLYLLELCQATQPKRKRRGRVGSFEPQHRQISN